MNISLNGRKDYPLQANLELSQLNDNTSLKKLLDLVQSDTMVVDFGCASGYFARLLQTKNCKIVGVEINEEAAQLAKQFCQTVIIADLDFNSVSEILPSNTFDVAVFGDVLEHLRNPWKVLQETKKILTPNGYVIASIPNIAHGDIRLALMQGKFEYQEYGILDNTHLRFFTRKTVQELFEETGYIVESITCTKLPLITHETSAPFLDKTAINPYYLEDLENQEDIDTLQFIIKAVPSSAEKQLFLLREQSNFLKSDLSTTKAQLIQTQTEYEQVKTQLIQTQIEQEQVKALLTQTQSECEQVKALLTHTQAECEQVKALLTQTQAECEQVKVQLVNSQTECEQVKAQLTHTQAECEQVKAQLIHTQTENEQIKVQHEQVKVQLVNSQTECEQVKAQLIHTQAECEQVKAQLTHTQAECEQVKAQLTHTQAECEQVKAQLTHTQAECEQIKAQLTHTQTEYEQVKSQLQTLYENWTHSQEQLHLAQEALEQSYQIIEAMETSKFWKLRRVWFKFKSLLGFKGQ